MLKVMVVAAFLAAGGIEAPPAQAADAASASPSAYDEAAMDEIGGLLKQGGNLVSQERYAEAVILGEKALALSERALGDGPYTALVLDDLGLFYAVNGQFDKAEAAYLRALGMTEYAQSIGIDMRDREISLCTKLGLLYRHTGRLEKAEPWFVRALAASDMAYGADSKQSAEAADHLAELYETQGRAAEAEPLRARARGNRAKAGS
ncbi:MAG: tetratricopeptide repeat protein [Asticcacaulis sp.]|nr:tetratricopeptide repeat protein [Asticcacaulis sp.]